MYQLIPIFDDVPTVYHRYRDRAEAMTALRPWLHARNLIGYEVVDPEGEVVYSGRGSA